MKPEIGKSYKTKSGLRASCIGLSTNMFQIRVDGVTSFVDDGCFWLDDKGIFNGLKEKFGDLSIVSEWNEGPIRTVTRKEIVVGEYGKIAIIDSNEQSVRLSLIYSGFDSSDLRSASKLFIELADALEENNRSAS